TCSPVKMTRISTLPLLHLVNSIFLVCLSASDAPAPIAPTARGVSVRRVFPAFSLVWYAACYKSKESIHPSLQRVGLLGPWDHPCVSRGEPCSSDRSYMRSPSPG